MYIELLGLENMNKRISSRNLKAFDVKTNDSNPNKNDIFCDSILEIRLIIHWLSTHARFW